MQQYRYTITGASRTVEPASMIRRHASQASSHVLASSSSPMDAENASSYDPKRDARFLQALDEQNVMLNDQQLQAVRHGEGPLLTIAGAGSGKTTTLACRAAYLIAVRRVPARQLLLVTFSRKAADEMKLRLAGLPGISTTTAKSIEARTFHSFCLQLLRRRGNQSAVLGDPGQQRMTVKRLLREAGTTLDYEPETLLALLSSYKCRLLTASDMPESSTAEREMKRVLIRYEQWKAESRAIDFDDVLLLAHRMLSEDEQLLATLQERFRYVMVDEFQDTNTVQYEIVRLIAGKQRNLMVVGDDDQTIYSFNGASADAILSFDKLYPDARVVTLSVNYRSSAAIVGLGNAIIRGNRNRRPKTLTVPAPREEAASHSSADGEVAAAAASDSPLSHAAAPSAALAGIGAEMPAASDDASLGTIGKPMFARPATSEEEASLITASVRKLVESGQYRYGDIAVLYRSAGSGRATIENLLQAGIPVEEHGEGYSFYESSLIRPVMAHLRISLHHRDKQAIEEMLPTLYVNRDAGMKWINEQESERAKKWPLIHLTNFPRLQQFQKDQVLERLRLIKAIASIRPATAIRRIRDAFFDKFAETNRGGTPHKELMKELLDELETSAGRFDTVEAFLAFADEMAKRQADARDKQKQERYTASAAPETEPGSVQMMTIHKSKGLEFPVVFVVGATENIMPHRSATQPQQPKQATTPEKAAREKEEAIEEERRLLYVAVTRARERLYVSSPAFYHGQKTDISRFLAEAGGAPHPANRSKSAAGGR
ncbi:UvrD/REP helicase [Paenibacillus curdlanolyticus YK9]|uniref:DNA 3'-5' helicase n=1 Tax=Paenibacillus curdlanolyticus YK9 TaxID=717606 RepID=E0IAL2_9BACL|nr:ATP-dependent helicase [Paenibacillus curdlanolyticus]EFM10416.1 UvrD/REP helicase [Paenibacillus curdlanolyticus YK9]